MGEPDVYEREVARARIEGHVLENGRRLLDEARRTIEQLDRLLGDAQHQNDPR